MSKTLVLAEKPSVGRDLAKVLKCNQNKGSYIEGSKYIVTWAMGHLVGLMDPEGYDNKYKEWKMETLPMLPKHMKLTVLKKTGRQYNEVKKQLLRNDVSDIVIATDAGREGELVARWILEKSGVKKPLKRLWISSQTEKAILDGFRNLKPGAAYENLYKAAVCRAEADWLVGLNVTRALTCKYNAQLSAGRVQSPTLSMIVLREDEIRNFKPKTYYTLEGKTRGFNLAWVNKDNNSRIFDEEFANKVASKLKNSEGKIVNINEANKKKFSPALYDLTELQRDANKIWGYSAKQTLNIMQRLYENYKILTYPRTDSRYITTDIVATIPDRLKAISIGEYRIVAEELLKGKIIGNKSFVDNSKVSDHHAIIPTEQKPNLALLSSEERKIYDLVVKRFLSVMLPPFEYIQTTIEAEVQGEKLVAKGKVIKAKGWKKLYDRLEEDSDEEEIKEQVLPTVSIGNSIRVESVNIKKGETKPPARFTEATLLSAMESPHKYINVSKEAAKTLGETGGLGTVATRADIIEKLFNSFVIEKKGKEIIPTSKGKQLMELVPKDLKSPLLTAKWESQLDEISKGKRDDHSFIKEMKNYSVALVEDVKGTNNKFVHDNKTGKKCPNCGKYLLEVKGKNGVMNVCQDRECGYRESVARVTNARCPECKKKLELRGNGEGAIYVCPGSNCNFREKASQFKKRFEKNGKIDKREVNNYMKKMKKEAEEFDDNPFAALLGDIKFDK
ncbi:DNA topoisomerase III [Clostridium beijerinckii]|jgi:DNA topoisomerase III, bacteria and conjugative plasmid|uniref:DNA topoisomerase 3 n=2 Tax=Clostridium beijerinckii TaxID=1520 RepID=A0AAE2RVJ0_CLOBE|nr:DNA topoisomerase III [Clostridium beijerinckii]ABR34044.1 DNA topoisomerase III [Clostridium beijerinckii NCIMB 8052]AIU00647.1 DNA topoisomerase III [Clostridium beijerinckii ATCC 35702]MBF7811351.1 DNA topoisomerase III [Clostridium beijerinckii]NRT24663.1 DNA topoisomerase-3 [Clostridium beijerinckii]NRT67745.1 DNA topoisomerase-3 [Clostridium beijerinckii]